jgi:hypothetical protein
MTQSTPVADHNPPSTKGAWFMAQQWVLMLEQLDAAKRIIIDGHELVPAWRIEAPDGHWLILTSFDHGKPVQRGRMLQLIRRFMAWKFATSFVLVAETWLGTTPTRTGEEAVLAISHERGDRLVFMQRIQRQPALSFGGLECVKPRDVDSAYWSVLPAREETVSPDEAGELQRIFGEHGELPAQKLH